MKKIILLILILLVLAAYPIYRIFKKESPTPASTINSNITTQSTPTAPETLAFPIDQFKERITKKPFGIYITPQNSPVSPERFTGYHTGADIEYEDAAADVPVYAIADGKIVLARTASGYGGVMIFQTILDDNQNHSILYGHIRPSSLPKIGEIKKGDQIGLLGTGYSAETDNERRHLHFAVLSDDRIDIKGYVQNKSELSGWLDPVSFYRSLK